MRNAFIILGIIVTVVSQTTAQDVGVDSFEISTPGTLSTGLCNSNTAYTFDIDVCEISNTAATVTEVNLYYTDNANFEDATTKGVANTVTLGSSASDIPVTADGQASNTGATVTIVTDVACVSYTHICVVTTTTNDNNAANDDACIVLDGGSTSTSNCPPGACTDPGTVENGQRQGSTFAHRDTVTYTCDTDYHLVGEGTLTCYDGDWDNDKPTCSDSAPTTEDATTKIQPTTADSGVEQNAHGLACMIATLTLTCMTFSF
ncbi:CUB and sushi domain-containing protein 2-like [Ptychodera flava]|uniref:CUB and sushi domain-containing protein 2-like n=1 Tax=Ptychodera flava TaxID=63121 RepID=UPI003969E97F